MKTTKKEAVLNFIEMFNENSIPEIQYSIKLIKGADLDGEMSWDIDIIEINADEEQKTYLSDPSKLMVFISTIGVNGLISCIGENPILHLF